MAFSSRELLLILRARDEASRVLRGFANEFANVDAAAMKAARNQMSAGSALVSVGVGMAGVGAVGLAWMKTSTDAAVEFNKKIAYTATQLDGVKASHNDLANAIKTTGRDIAVPIEQLHEGLYDIFSSMDVNMPQAKSLLRSFAKEAVAGQVDLQTASRATIGILNAFHLSVDQVTRVQDVQFQLVRKGVGTYEEFAKVMGRATPSAARAGQSVETLAGMLAYLTRNGLSAAMASASAGRAFDAMSNPKTVDRMEQMGIKVKNAAGEFRPFTELITDLQKHLADMTAPERAEALQELFKGSGGTIQARRFYDAVLKDEQSVAQFVGLVGDMQNAQGAFGQAYNTMANTTASKSQLLQNQWQLLRIEIGQALVPVFERLMAVLSVVLGWWNKLDDGTKKQIVTWAAIGAAGLVALGIMVMMAGAFMMLAGAAAAAGIGIFALVGIFLAIGVGIAALVVVGILLYKNWDTVIRALADAWNWLWDILKPIIDWLWSVIGGRVIPLFNRMATDVVNAVKTVGDWVARIWNDIAGWTAKVWPGIKQVVGPIIDWFVGVWPYVKNVITDVLRIIVDTFSAAWTAISGVLEGAWIIISNVVEGIIHIFQGIIDFVVGILTGNWKQAWDGIRLIFQGVWEIIWGIISGVWTAIVGVIEGALEFVVSIVSNGFNAVMNVIRIILDGIGRVWNQFWDWVGAFFSGILNGVHDGAKSILDKVVGAFVNGVKWIGEQWNKLMDICKIPINFVIDFVYNKGIRWIWNKVADFVGLPGLPEAKLLADGGPVRGAGGPRDDKILARLSNGEYVMPADKTAKYYPMLEAMRAGYKLPGFADGGPIGQVIDWVGDVGKDVVDALTHPIDYIVKGIGNAAKVVKTVAGIPVNLIEKVGPKLMYEIAGKERVGWRDELISWFAGNDMMNGTDPRGMLVSGLKMFANAQKNKKYLWGATGPNNWDCSGLVGALWALTRGMNPYQRHMTTAGMGAGKYGMKSGAGKFTVYLGEGHTAANIDGLHAEAYGGDGVPLAIGRVGTPLSYYNQILHVFKDGGFVDIKNNPMKRMASWLAKGWPEPLQFDQGGWFEPGWNFNGTGLPEAVLDPEQSAALLRIADDGTAGGQSVQQNFYITTQEIDPRKHAADLGYEIMHGRVV